MKNYLTACFALLALLMHAQKEVNFTETIKTNQAINLEFKFADNIEIIHGKSNELKIEATVLIEDGEGNEFYSIKSDSFGDELVVKSDFGDYFKNKRKENRWNNCYTETDIDYVVYVPKNSDLFIKSISGSVNINDFNGELQTDLISGDVTIKKYEGELHLKTISGAIDVTVLKAKLSAKSLTGTIYSNIEFETDLSKKAYNGSSNKITKTINKGTKPLKMETISGNIYIRKG